MSAIDPKTRKIIKKAGVARIEATPSDPSVAVDDVFSTEGFSESSGRTGRRLRRSFFSDFTGDGMADF